MLQKERYELSLRRFSFSARVLTKEELIRLKSQLQQLQNLFYPLFYRLIHIYPVNGNSPSLHAPEPGHLSFGKLVNGDIELGHHFVVAQTARHVLGDKLILQAIINQVLGTKSFSQQSLHLSHQSLLQALLQAPCDFFAPHVPFDVHPNKQGTDFGQLDLNFGVTLVIGFNFNGTYRPLMGIGIGAVVQNPELRQYFLEFGQRLVLEQLPERRVGRNMYHLVLLQHGHNIQTRSATQDGPFTPFLQVLKNMEEVVLKLIDIVLITGLPNVNQVRRDALSLHHIIRVILPGTQIHPAVNLSRIGTDDFAVQGPGQMSRKGSFS